MEIFLNFNCTPFFHHTSGFMHTIWFLSTQKKLIIYCSLVQLAAINSNLIPLIVSSLCVKKVEIFLKLNCTAFFHHTSGFTHAIWFLSMQKKVIIYCSLVQLAAMNSDLIPLIVSLLCLKKVEIFLKLNCTAFFHHTSGFTHAKFLVSISFSANYFIFKIKQLSLHSDLFRPFYCVIFVYVKMCNLYHLGNSTFFAKKLSGFSHPVASRTHWQSRNPFTAFYFGKKTFPSPLFANINNQNPSQISFFRNIFVVKFFLLCLNPS